MHGAILRVASHELTHFIQDKNAADYKALKNFCFGHILQAHTQEEIDRQRAAIIESNKNADNELSPEAAIDEMVANACEQILTNSDILIELYKQNASLAERVQLHVSEFFAKLRENIGNGARVKEAAWMADAIDELQKKWEAALRVAADNQIKLNSVEGTKNTATEGGVKEQFALVGYTKDGRRVYETDFDPAVSEKDRIDIFEERIATIFNLGAVVLKTDTKKIKVLGDKFTSEKNLYGDFVVDMNGNVHPDAEERSAKINALYDMADILQGAKFVPPAIPEDSYITNNPPKNKAHKNVKYWYKFTTNIVMDGKGYKVTFNIRDKGKGGQYQYLIEFKKDGTSGNGNTAVSGLLRTNPDVPRNNDTTKIRLRQEQNSAKLSADALDIGEAEQISDEELLWQMRLEDAPEHAQESLREYQQLVSERNDLQRKLNAIEADAEKKTGISAMSKRQLQAKIRQLEKQVKQARAETKLTAAKREARLKNIDASSVIHSVTDAVANESSLKRYAKEELHQLYSDVLALTDNGKEAAAQELLQNGATQLAGRIFNQLQVENDADVQSYDDIKSFMNKQSIRVSPEIMRAIAGPRQEDWNGYRAANGQRIVVTNGDTNIEDLYQQLAEIAPTIFDDQTYNLSDMADRIVSVLKDAYDNTSAVIPFTEMSDYSDEQYDYYVGKLYAAILEDFKGRATPIAQTVADRIENELQEKYGIQISELQAELKQQKALKQKAEKAAAAARNAESFYTVRKKTCNLEERMIYYACLRGYSSAGSPSKRATHPHSVFEN